MDLALGRPQHHGNTPKGTPTNFSRNRSGVGKIYNFKLPYLWNGGSKFLLTTNRNMYMRFHLYQNRWPWMTLKCNNSLCYITCLPFGAHHYQQQKCSTETLLCEDIRVMPIFVGVRWIRTSNKSRVVSSKIAIFAFCGHYIFPKIIYDSKIIMSEYVVPQWLFIHIETDDL